MNEKSGFHTGSSAPSGPPMPNQSMQPDAPPPYSPYVTGPTELDASKPYGHQAGSGPAIGFEPVSQGIVGQQAPPKVQGSAYHGQESNPPVVHHVVTTMVQLGPESVRMSCPFCKADMSSFTTKAPSIVAYISAAVCCLVGCYLGCCLIPLCMDSCQKVDHHCPNCRKFLGKYTQY